GVTAEPLDEQRPRDDRRTARSGRLFVPRECTPEHRPCAGDVEEAWRDIGSDAALWIVIDFDSVATNVRHPFDGAGEGSGLRLPIGEGGIRRSAEFRVVTCLIDGRETPGVAVRPS